MLLPRSTRSLASLGRRLLYIPPKPLSLTHIVAQRPFFQHPRCHFRWNAYEPPPKDHPAFQKPPKHSGRRQGTGGSQWLSGIQTIKYRYQTNPTFRFLVKAFGAGYAIFIIYNIERVPETGRLRLNCVSQEYEEKVGKSAYEGTMNEYRNKILPDMHPQTIRVRRVLNRLIPAVGLKNQEWEVHVIDDKEANAFVIPG